jgi:hypothetical protein
MNPITADELMPLIDLLPTGGCCLHIAVDDFNLDDDAVKFCVKEAQRRDHPMCYAIALLILGAGEEWREAELGVYDRWQAPFSFGHLDETRDDRIGKLERENADLKNRLRITTELLEGKSPTV